MTMDKFIVTGGKKLSGTTTVSGAKNVALKALVAACLTSDEVIIDNVPLISDFLVMADIIRHLGGRVDISGHTATIQMKKFTTDRISLEKAAEIRTSCMFIAPMLARLGKASIPNPGGCRIGARPIDRTIEGLKYMGAIISYDSTDGYFHGMVEQHAKRLQATHYRFEKNTHTGTETLLIAAVLANGQTVIENAAEEPEIDELIAFLNKMGGKVRRLKPRTIIVDGVERLHGTTFTIGPDRNEVVTLAIAAMLTEGDIVVEQVTPLGLTAFLEKLEAANGGIDVQEKGIRFFYKGPIQPVDVTTAPYPGFMTDWQSPWAVLMTKAEGTTVVHETVYESRFGYVQELRKMGARIALFRPEVSDPENVYNFNIADDKKEHMHAARISGPVTLHNAVVSITDLRAGATLVLAALAAKGKTVIFGIEHLDRGYERFEERLQKLGASLIREQTEE